MWMWVNALKEFKWTNSPYKKCGSWHTKNVVTIRAWMKNWQENKTVFFIMQNMGLNAGFECRHSSHKNFKQWGVRTKRGICQISLLWCTALIKAYNKALRHPYFKGAGKRCDAYNYHRLGAIRHDQNLFGGQSFCPKTIFNSQVKPTHPNTKHRIILGPNVWQTDYWWHK